MQSPSHGQIDIQIDILISPSGQVLIQRYSDLERNTLNVDVVQLIGCSNKQAFKQFVEKSKQIQVLFGDDVLCG